jgi:DNA-binding XRE family transcriptional regulator
MHATTKSPIEQSLDIPKACRARTEVGRATLGHKRTSVISEYETGRLLPSLPTALKLAVFYNRSVAERYPSLYGQVQQEIEALVA